VSAAQSIVRVAESGSDGGTFVDNHGSASKTVLVTGGAGFIGSHACKALARAGFQPIVFDDLSTGRRNAVRWGPLMQGDLKSRSRVDKAVQAAHPIAVMHFAASAYVDESLNNPGKYYENNVAATLNLLEAMRLHGIRQLIFSSSCATYGAPDQVPISERAIQRPRNPYGRSKLFAEQIILDYARAYGLEPVILRYFNACGADADGDLGEDHDPETHLIPRALMAASGLIPHLDIFGADYPTPDGTCIRDYVHVGDLATAHVLALEHLIAGRGSAILNIGIGQGFSVKEVVDATARVTGRPVPVRIGARRADNADPPVLIADPALSRSLLGFAARFNEIDEMIATAWRWQSRPSTPANSVAGS
jgi:UDP-arabinose 4-epimerase